MNNIPPDQWRTSSRTKANDPQCVEVRLVNNVVHVQDTKARGQGLIPINKSQWRTFMTAVKRGDFNLDT